MTEAINEVINSNKSRESLIALKNRIKDEHIRLDEDDIYYLMTLLKLPDPKSRKNVAQILGLLKAEQAVNALYSALETEDTEYVKSAYLYALKDIDFGSIRNELMALRARLSAQEVTASNRKHYNEQMEAYNDLLGSNITKHTFTGKEVPSEVILITPKGLGNYTSDAIYSDVKKVISAGVCAQISSIEEIRKVRTYKEFLYIIPEIKRLDPDPESVAEALAKGYLREFLKLRHKEDTPWGYRVSLVGAVDENKKTQFIKRMSGELYRLSKGFFVNQASDYELEIRLLYNKDGNITCMFKLFTIKDERFDYRKEHVAESIRPELAANLMYIAADYLKSNVQVLDPFCGVGTMLIERYRYRKASPLYGVDKFGEAITKAKENSTIAGVEAYYVNRDFFDFKHEYLFDEIITNMPFSKRPEDKYEMKELYKKFFGYAKKLIKRGAYVIMYTRDYEFADEYSGKYGFYSEKEELISEKEKAYLCIYRKK